MCVFLIALGMHITELLLDWILLRKNTLGTMMQEYEF